MISGPGNPRKLVGLFKLAKQFQNFKFIFIKHRNTHKNVLGSSEETAAFCLACEHILTINLPIH